MAPIAANPIPKNPSNMLEKYAATAIKMIGKIVLMYPRAKPFAKLAAVLDLELSTSD